MKSHLSILAAVAAASGSAAAGQAPQPAPAAVPRATFIATMNSEFRKMDANKDGVLTRAEVENSQRAAAALAMQARQRALFAKLDADRNGTLTLQEFARLPIPAPPVNAAPILAQTDLNHDGKVTLIEYRTGKLANFDRMDTDKDGVVSAAEMKAAGLVR